MTLIKRADAIEAVRKELVCDGRHEIHDKTCRFIADVLLSALPSAEGGDAEMLNEDFRPKYMQQCPTDGADLINREDAIRWVKTECNPYGKPTLAFESGIKVIEHLKQMPSALPSAEAVQGEWKPFDLTWGRNIYFCTACKESTEVPTVNGQPSYNYCPNCGARMYKGGDDE